MKIEKVAYTERAETALLREVCCVSAAYVESGVNHVVVDVLRGRVEAREAELKDDLLRCSTAHRLLKDIERSL